MARTPIVSLCCTLLFSWTSTQAEDMAFGKSSDLHSVVELALANSPSVQKALAGVQQARGLRYQSTRSPNPVLGYSASEVGQDGKAGQQGVFLNQNFRVADKLDFNDQIGGWAVQAATWEWKAEQLRVTGNVRVRWFDAAAAGQRVELLNQLHEVLERSQAAAKSLLEAGESSRGPLLQAQLEVRRNQLAIRNAESVYGAARRQLAAVAAIDESQLPESFSGLSDSLSIPDEETFVTGLFTNSPELLQARAEVTQNQWNVRRQQVEPLPDLQTQFTVQYDNATDYTVGGIQLGWALPLFDRNRGNISAANAGHIKASHEVHRKELDLRRRAVAAYRDLTVAQRETDTIDGELIPIARENLAATTQSYKAGESTFQALLIAQRSYVELILARIDAQRRTRQAEAIILSQLLAEPLE